MNYLSIAKKVNKVINGLGMPVTLSRGGVTLFTTNAVFLNSMTVVDTTLGDSLLSKVNNLNSDCYIGGTVPVQPTAGDLVMGLNRSYTIVSVQTYKPATLPLGYKLSLE